MTPESGHMTQPTIRLEAEYLTDQMLEQQIALNDKITEMKTGVFASLREASGLTTPDEIDRTKLTNTRVKSITTAIEVDALKSVLVPSPRSVSTVLDGRESATKILSGEDDRLLVIAGPCSIHDPDQGMIYAKRLAEMRDHYGNHLEIVMRTYLEKPRSELGWKGLINDPNINGTTAISLGLTMSRLFLCQVTDIGVPTALERLDSLTTQYFDDLAVVDAIGARDSLSNRGRVYLSVTSAVGLVKNPLDGDLEKVAEAVRTAHTGHTYIGDDEQGLLAAIESEGNPTVTPILRGGAKGPNFNRASVQEMKSILSIKSLPESIGIDASHGNSGKVAAKQVEVVRDVSSQIALGETAIKLVMIESNLVAGQQAPGPIDTLEFGVSITDECVGLGITEQMMDTLSQAVQARRVSN
ncbi:MAG TPA: 3-deoxy-7-phosphoheptulonate synthase [Candidatus Saccharimonadales bacterium]|nr:3-deoxy-7-phosphoheptulonate synthase [Candidatus Saccharimonadales bacterium]